MMEALACRDGLQFAVQQGALPVIRETDNQVLVSLWMSQKNSEIRGDLGFS